MSDYLNISDFLSTVDLAEISHNEDFKDGQLGKSISIYRDEFLSWMM
jgi:hypothetical protein